MGWLSVAMVGPRGWLWAASAHGPHAASSARLPCYQRSGSHHCHYPPGLAHTRAQQHSQGPCQCPTGREEPTLPGTARGRGTGLSVARRAVPVLPGRLVSVQPPHLHRWSCWGWWTCRLRRVLPSTTWSLCSASAAQHHQGTRVQPGACGQAGWARAGDDPTEENDAPAGAAW